jgi:CCR4-NOT transcription complex subunit 6
LDSNYIFALPSSRFTLVEKHLIEFQQIAMQRPDLRKTEDVFNRVMVKDNIAIVTLLESKESPNSRILVANAHLHWDPTHKDVKLVQTAMLMEEITKLTVSYTAPPSQGGGRGAGPNIKVDRDMTALAAKSGLPIIVAGDFNSLPNSGVYEFLGRGSVPQDHSDFGTYQYGPYTSEGLSHKLSLKSSYSHIGELDFTNLTPTFKGVIDYVWYGTTTLTVTGLLSNVEREYVARTVGFPNAHQPSDHIPLVVSFRYKNKTNKN